jgi:hypothetical protein
MADRAIDTYLNDHLGGAMLGTELANQIQEQTEGTPLSEVMTPLAGEIEEDRKTLVKLMEQMGTPRNPVKRVTGWVAEKASRVKFGGLAGEPQYGTFMALESLRLGVVGKGCMWKVLKEVADRYPPLAATDLDGLFDRAERQQTTIERERIALGRQVLEPIGE